MSAALIAACPHCNALNRVPADRLGDGATCGKCKAALFAAIPAELDATAFEAHAGRSELPLVIDFWAPWCAPCRAMAPEFARAAAELEPHYRLAKINTEEQPALAARFGIRSIPTIIVFKQGRELARRAGASDAASLVRWVRSAS